MVARAEHGLSTFTLDAVARQVKSVTVNGLPAEYQLDNSKEKLTVKPRIPLLPGLPFRTAINFVTEWIYGAKTPPFPA